MTQAVSRRGFLGAVAGAALMGWERLASRAAAAEAGLEVGIQSYSLRGYPTDVAIQHAHELGFRAIEFYGGMFSPASTSEQIRAMLDKLGGLGMRITAHGVNRMSRDHEANRKLFEFARAAGIRNITADPDPDSFESLDSLVKEFDIRVAIHNHGPRHRYNKAVDVLNAVEKHDERIGACADLGHYIRSGEDAVQVIRLLAGRLYGIHLKDFAEKQDKTKGVILGQGHLDLAGVFQALKQVGFPADGALSLEYEENPQNPLDDIRQCLAVAREAAAKVL